MRIQGSGFFATIVLIAALAGPACGPKEAPDAPPPQAKAAAQAGKPSIACDEAVFDFGTVQQGEDAKHVFKVKNVGNALLKIDSARGG